MNNKVKAFLFVALLGVLSVVLSAYNIMHTDNGTEMRWSDASMPIGWYLDSDGSDDLPLDAVRQALQSAFDVWQSIPCAKVEFEYRGEVDLTPDDCGTIPIDHRNVMIWNETDWPSEWRGAIAVCQPVYNPTTGEIIDADIVFDGFDYTWSATEFGSPDKMDVWNVATHEIGHLLGLAHPGEDGTEPHTEATMNPSSFQGETFRRYPALDDIFGVCHLYPQNGELGWQCQSDADCNSGNCITDEHTGWRFCSQTCGSTDDCPPPFLCSSGGFCVPRWIYLSFLGEDCSNEHPCAHGYACATDPNSGKQVCTRECTADCPDGFACIPLDSSSFCFASSSFGNTIGEQCSEDNPCNSRYECVEIYRLGARCTRECPPECPPQFDCLSLTSGSRLCWPQTPEERENGRECSWGQHCASGVCAKDGNVYRCAQQCDNQPCEDGFECRSTTDENGSAVKACLPVSAVAESRAVIESLNTTPQSPAPPSEIEVNCQANSANGVVYKVWYVSPNGDWSAISDWSTSGSASVLLVKNGLHRFVCWARDLYSPELFDDAQVVDFIVDSSIVPDGDTEQLEDSLPFEEKKGGSDGCNGVNTFTIFAVFFMLIYLRRII